MVQSEDVERSLTRLTLHEKAAQLVWLTVHGATADEAHPVNRDRYGVDTPAEVIAKLAPGGVVYFAWSDNTAHPVQTAALSAGLQEAAANTGAGIPLGIAIDEEGGRVTRIGPPNTRWPSARAVAAGATLGEAEERWRHAGNQLAAAGITVNLAPSLDVATMANQVISTRSFSTDPAVVGAHGVAAVRGLHAGGVRAVVKHFPGHGACVADSHFELPTVELDERTYRRDHITPFAEVLRSAPPSAVMPGHLLVPAIDPAAPATLSSRWLTEILRGELGFTGATMSDSMSMGALHAVAPGEAAVQAVRAGMDVLITPSDPEAIIAAIVRAVRDGRISEARLDEAATHALALKVPEPARTGWSFDRAAAGGLAARIAAGALETTLGAQALPLPSPVLVAGTRNRPVRALTDALTSSGISAACVEVPDAEGFTDRTPDAGQGGDTARPDDSSTKSVWDVRGMLEATSVPTVIITGDVPSAVERSLLAYANLIVDVGSANEAFPDATVLRIYGDDATALAAAAQQIAGAEGIRQI